MEEDALTLPLLREDGPSAPQLRRSKSSEALCPSGSSLGQTTFNTVNLFLGVGLLSMPYAIHKGGWAALVPLCLVTSLFGLSAHLIIAAFDRLPPLVPKTYPELGAHAGGKLGHRLVVTFALIELFGGSCIVLLVVWQQLVLFLPAAGLWGYPPLTVAAAAASAALVPTLLVKNFKNLSWLSMLGFAGAVLVTAVVLSLLPLDLHRTKMPQQPPPGHHLLSTGILQSVGIIAVSVSGHSTLPSLRAAMQRPSRFPRVLNITFGTMLLVYSALAAAGYYYFGDAAAPLVTTSIAQDSVLSGRALLGALTVDRLLAGLILVNCFTKYPILILVMQDMILSLFPDISTPCGSPRTPRHTAVFAVRFALFVAGVGLSFCARSVLGCVISLVGGLCSISCSLLLPTAFYSLLAWRDLRWPARAGLAALLLGGVALVCSITLQNLLDIASHARHQEDGREGALSLAALAGLWR